MIQLIGLRAARGRRLLSQAELAELSGVSKNTIHRLETGTSEARGRTIRKLAAALDIQPDVLWSEDGSADVKRAA